MTACMYVQPGGKFAAFIADTMATPASPGQIIPPAARTLANQNQPHNMRIVRKLYIIDKRTVVAFSGKESRIIECLNKISSALPALLLNDDPMDGVAKIANTYGDDVRMIGMTLQPRGARANVVSPADDRFELPLLGECAAVGSGKKALRDWATDYDQDAPNEQREEASRTSIAFSQMVSATSLAKEIAGEVDTWGACIEFAYPAGECTWRYGQKTLYVFLEPIAPNTKSAKMVRFLAYDPGGNDGRLLMGSEDTLEEHLIENVFERSLPEDIIGGREFWTGWNPECVMMTLIVRQNSADNIYLSESFGPEAAKFNVDEKGTISVLLSDMVMREFSNTMTQILP